jgi:hypothetical protein
MFEAYRSNFYDRGLPGGGGMAFMPLVYTADSQAEAEKGARQLTWYLGARAEPQYRNPPSVTLFAKEIYPQIRELPRTKLLSTQEAAE